jgi:hypothetical protein
VIAELVSLRPPDQQTLQVHASITKTLELSGLGIALICSLRASTLQPMSSPRIPHAVFDTPVKTATWIATLDAA